eukprot:1136971-Pelagomonas_calceolata.AAC.2
MALPSTPWFPRLLSLSNLSQVHDTLPTGNQSGAHLLHGQPFLWVGYQKLGEQVPTLGRDVHIAGHVPLHGQDAVHHDLHTLMAGDASLCVHKHKVTDSHEHINNMDARTH